MSNTLAHSIGTFFGALPSSVEVANRPENVVEPEPPVGYRRVSRRWKVLPDGTRDYAAYHGNSEFRVLLPVSSKLAASKR